MIDPFKGDAIVDYRQSDEAIVQDIEKALNNQKLEHAFDATADHKSYVNLSKVLDQNAAKTTLVLPPKDDLTGKHKEIPDGIYQSNTNVGDAHGEEKDLAYMYTGYFTKDLEEGCLKAQKQEEVAGGLAGIEGVLERLKEGSTSATEFVFKIADTPGVMSSE